MVLILSLPGPQIQKKLFLRLIDLVLRSFTKSIQNLKEKKDLLEMEITMLEEDIFPMENLYSLFMEITEIFKLLQKNSLADTLRP